MGSCPTGSAGTPQARLPLPTFVNSGRWGVVHLQNSGRMLDEAAAGKKKPLVQTKGAIKKRAQRKKNRSAKPRAPGASRAPRTPPAPQLVRGRTLTP